MSIKVTMNPLNNINANENNETNDYFGIDECAGDAGFEFADNWSRPYFKSAHTAISRCELWNWFKNYQPDEGLGFMFTRNVPELDRLSKEMLKDPVNDGHSGSSYACTMRNMEFIAKNGYQRFKSEILKEKEIKAGLELFK
jgi:hypothetical protein